MLVLVLRVIHTNMKKLGMVSCDVHRVFNRHNGTRVTGINGWHIKEFRWVKNIECEEFRFVPPSRLTIGGLETFHEEAGFAYVRQRTAENLRVIHCFDHGN